MAHYIHDDLNNRIEGLSKEEIYALIDEVIASGELPTEAQTAFVTALKSIVDGNPYKIGFCTTAEYNELEAQGELQEDALYIITDDNSYYDLITYINNKILDLKDNEIAALQSNVTNLQGRVTELERYPINVEIDSSNPTLSQDLSTIITNGAIISACFKATKTSSSTDYYFSEIIHINSLNNDIDSIASYESSELTFRYNSSVKKLQCSASLSSWSNPQWVSIKLLAKW